MSPSRREPRIVPGRVVAVVMLAGVALVLGGTIGLALAAYADDDGPQAVAGEDGGDVAGGGGTELVGGEFFFEPGSVTSGPSVELTLVNEGAVLHNVEIEGVDGFKVEADAGATATESVELEAGTYVLFCSIAGHRDAGMEGELVVS